MGVSESGIEPEAISWKGRGGYETDGALFSSRLCGYRGGLTCNYLGPAVFLAKVMKTCNSPCHMEGLEHTTGQPCDVVTLAPVALPVLASAIYCVKIYLPLKPCEDLA